MPRELSRIGRLAREHNISYACAKYRDEQGIPMETPTQPNGNAKAWATRNASIQALIAERRKRMEWQAREKARRDAREARERKRQAKVAARVAARLAAEMKRQEEPFTTINSAPRQAWSNPLALLAGSASTRGRSPTAPTTSSSSVTAQSSRGDRSRMNYGGTA